MRDLLLLVSVAAALAVAVTFTALLFFDFDTGAHLRPAPERGAEDVRAAKEDAERRRENEARATERRREISFNRARAAWQEHSRTEALADLRIAWDDSKDAVMAAAIAEGQSLCGAYAFWQGVRLSLLMESSHGKHVMFDEAEGILTRLRPRWAQIDANAKRDMRRFAVQASRDC